MEIQNNLVKNFSERIGYKADVIVVHISAGSLTSMTSWFSTPNSQASAHYGVGKNGTILRYVQEEKKAWTQGNVNKPTSEIVLERKGINPNNYCISIECEEQDLFNGTDEQINSLCTLIKDIAYRNNIPLDRKHILGHFEIDSKNRNYCPSKDHSIIEKIVNMCNQDELVNIQVPKSKLARITDFLLKI
jgi:N-acetyl-anhydromuramyl-L-alanine amidase AmpD